MQLASGDDDSNKEETEQSGLQPISAADYCLALIRLHGFLGFLGFPGFLGLVDAYRYNRHSTAEVLMVH